MDFHVDAYDLAYSELGQKMLHKIGQDVYGEYVGQLSWMTIEEYRRFIARLAPTPESHVLEIGSGNGAAAVYLSTSTKARVTGMDNNESGIALAEALAKSKGLEDRVHFQLGDARRPFPFPDATFDAVFANDTFSLFPERLELLRQCNRVLRPNGRLLFTDPMVLVGLITSDELATRTWCSSTCLSPRGENERMLEATGFQLMSYEDLTESVVVVARRQAAAFEKYREQIVGTLGQEVYDGLTSSTEMASTLADQKRMVRIAFLARKVVSR